MHHVHRERIKNKAENWATKHTGAAWRAERLWCASVTFAVNLVNGPSFETHTCCWRCEKGQPRLKSRRDASAQQRFGRSDTNGGWCLKARHAGSRLFSYLKDTPDFPHQLSFVSFDLFTPRPYRRRCRVLCLTHIKTLQHHFICCDRQVGPKQRFKVWGGGFRRVWRSCPNPDRCKFSQTLILSTRSECRLSCFMV